MKPSSAQLRLGPLALPGETSREIPAKQPRWLTDAVATVVHAQRGTVKRIASALGVTDKAVYEVADINVPKPLKAWWLPAICEESGSFAVLDAIEARLGRVAFRLPPTNPNVDEMNRELARDVQIFGEMLAAYGDVMADGVIEPYERNRMLAQIDKVLAGVGELREMVVRKADSDAA